MPHILNKAKFFKLEIAAVDQLALRKSGIEVVLPVILCLFISLILLILEVYGLFGKNVRRKELS